MFTRLIQRAKLDDHCGLIGDCATVDDDDDSVAVNAAQFDRFVASGRKFTTPCWKCDGTAPLHRYWHSLGLANFPYVDRLRVDPSADPVVAAYECVRDCNRRFFRRIDEPVVCATWDVDGVCATGKTSVAPRIQKSNRRLHMIGQNLHLSSALGYVFSSAKMMHSRPHTVWDRTAFNNVHPWYYSWLLIAHVHLNYDRLYRGVYKNAHYSRAPPPPHQQAECGWFDEVLSDAVLDVWRRHATAVHPHTRRALGRLARHVVVVDSDERRATERLRARATGSDVERSWWPHYVRIQNYMYAQMALLDPDHYCLIDLNAFGGDQSLMQAVIRKIIADHPPVGDETVVAAFEPLEPTAVKPLLTQDAEEAERARPVQTWQFTNDTKQFVEEYADFGPVASPASPQPEIADEEIERLLAMLESQGSQLDV